MSYRLDKDGKAYIFMTRREAEERTRKPIRFSLVAEIKAILGEPAPLHNKGYEIVTQREAEGRTGTPIQFNSRAEAKTFMQQIAATPEGATQLRQLLAELQAAKTEH